MTRFGRYRGMRVEIVPVPRGDVSLFTDEPRATEEGFVPYGFERPGIQQWVKNVAPDDAELRRD
ncbi:hypothetical protein ACTJKK_13045 [Microbacterium sp. 22179]|uniref:hypothetical protein n=1 Tax=Microbacterium sp. 22179 TaxID=3453886 RepID=UPI003F851289